MVPPQMHATIWYGQLANMLTVAHYHDALIIMMQSLYDA